MEPAIHSIVYFRHPVTGWVPGNVLAINTREDGTPSFTCRDTTGEVMAGLLSNEVVDAPPASLDTFFPHAALSPASHVAAVLRNIRLARGRAIRVGGKHSLTMFPSPDDVETFAEEARRYITGVVPKSLTICILGSGAASEVRSRITAILGSCHDVADTILLAFFDGGANVAATVRLSPLDGVCRGVGLQVWGWERRDCLHAFLTHGHPDPSLLEAFDSIGAPSQEVTNVCRAIKRLRELEFTEGVGDTCGIVPEGDNGCLTRIAELLSLPTTLPLLEVMTSSTVTVAGIGTFTSRNNVRRARRCRDSLCVSLFAALWHRVLVHLNQHLSQGGGHQDDSDRIVTIFEVLPPSDSYLRNSQCDHVSLVQHHTLLGQGVTGGAVFPTHARAAVEGADAMLGRIMAGTTSVDDLLPSSEPPFTISHCHGSVSYPPEALTRPDVCLNVSSVLASSSSAWVRGMGVTPVEPSASEFSHGTRRLLDALREDDVWYALTLRCEGPDGRHSALHIERQLTLHGVAELVHHVQSFPSVSYTWWGFVSTFQCVVPPLKETIEQTASRIAAAVWAHSLLGEDVDGVAGHIDDTIWTELGPAICRVTQHELCVSYPLELMLRARREKARVAAGGLLARLLRATASTRVVRRMRELRGRGLHVGVMAAMLRARISLALRGKKHMNAMARTMAHELSFFIRRTSFVRRARLQAKEDYVIFLAMQRKGVEEAASSGLARLYAAHWDPFWYDARASNAASVAQVWGGEFARLVTMETEARRTTIEVIFDTETRLISDNNRSYVRQEVRGVLRYKEGVSRNRLWEEERVGVVDILIAQCYAERARLGQRYERSWGTIEGLHRTAWIKLLLTQSQDTENEKREWMVSGEGHARSLMLKEWDVTVNEVRERVIYQRGEGERRELEGMLYAVSHEGTHRMMVRTSEDAQRAAYTLAHVGQRILSLGGEARVGREAISLEEKEAWRATILRNDGVMALCVVAAETVRRRVMCAKHTMALISDGFLVALHEGERVGREVMVRTERGTRGAIGHRGRSVRLQTEEAVSRLIDTPRYLLMHHELIRRCMVWRKEAVRWYAVKVFFIGLAIPTRRDPLVDALAEREKVDAMLRELTTTTSSYAATPRRILMTPSAQTHTPSSGGSFVASVIGQSSTGYYENTDNIEGYLQRYRAWKGGGGALSPPL